MGRPRKDATTQEIRERLIEAMSNRLVHEPINAVTVASLIEEVGCNRSTFYYHFVNVAQLSEVALDAAVPVDIPLAVLSFIQKGIPPRKENLEGSDSRRTKADASDSEDGLSRSPLFASINIPDLVCQNSRKIDTLCAILNGPNAPLAQKQIKQRFWEEILPELGASLALNADDPKFRIVFEYASAGILALMAYRAETGFAYPVETFLQYLVPEIPTALLTILSQAD